jgi:hypothetical protein
MIITNTHSGGTARHGTNDIQWTMHSIPFFVVSSLRTWRKEEEGSGLHFFFLLAGGVSLSVPGDGWMDRVYHVRMCLYVTVGLLLTITLGTCEGVVGELLDVRIGLEGPAWPLTRSTNGEYSLSG